MSEATDWWASLSDGRRVSIHRWLTGAHTRRASEVAGQLAVSDDQFLLFKPSDIPAQPGETRSADAWWSSLTADRQHSIQRWLVHGEPLTAEVRGQLAGLVDA